MIDYIADWRARLRKRLYWQFRSKPRWQALADLLAAQAQDLEDATQTLFSFPNIDDSEGPQLDLIGRIIGQVRLGTSDAVYRMYLKARVLINRSSGRFDELYAVLKAAFGDIGFRITEGGTKALDVRIVGVVTAAQAAAAAFFLRDAKDAGVRIVMQWQEAADANTFRFDVGPGFDVGLLSDAIEV